MVMQIQKIIINEYLENNSFITTKQAESMGISRHILSLMAKDKRIKRVKQGIYTKNDNLIDIYYLLSLNTNKVIFSYETALYLNNYIKRNTYCQILNNYIYCFKEISYFFFFAFF